MTGILRTVGIVTLAVALVAGAFLSVSVLAPEPGAQAVDTQDRSPAGVAVSQAPSPPEREPRPAETAAPADDGILVQPPGAPRDLIAAWVEDSIVLTWLAPAEGEVTHYTVTRTHWDDGAQVERSTVGGPATRYIDNDARGGVTTYTYTVTSHSGGQKSPPVGVMVTGTVPVPVEASELARQSAEEASAHALSQELEAAPIFDPDAGYEVFTKYGAATEIQLADYLSGGTGEAAFALKSCDGSSGDYYDSVTVSSGILEAVSNTRGHVHGQNTETATACTITGSTRTDSEDREFRLYTVPDRTPPGLLPGTLTLVEARATEADLRVSGAGSHLGYVRLAWRTGGGRPSFAVAQGVTDGMVLTIAGLEPETQYEVRAYLMTRQAFHMYSAGGPTPDSKWVGNLPGGGLGKSQGITILTPVQPAPPPPTPEPTPLQTPVITLRPTPSQEPEDQDTPETDNDGIDTPVTPDTDDTNDTPTPDTPTPDTPTPVTPDTPTPVTPDTPTPDTPTPVTPDTPTPDTPTPVTPDTPTPDTGSDEDDSDENS